MPCQKSIEIKVFCTIVHPIIPVHPNNFVSRDLASFISDHDNKYYCNDGLAKDGLREIMLTQSRTAII